MSGPETFYITTTLPYINAAPHIGFATELIRADAIARYKELNGYRIFFNTGTDEHGVKVYEKAQEEGLDPQAYTDRMAEQFRALQQTLNLHSDLHFIRTTDKHHMEAAQAFWRRCDENGYIYKKFYEVKYCKGCELEKTDSELVDGRCPLHPNLDLELIAEENYFFMFSEFAGKLLSYYQENPTFVIPDFRFNEIKSFIERGLEDFSISRLKEKMPWGVPVPGDDAHVMYVWFDALVNYISTLGWPDETERFQEFWEMGETVQIAGKDNVRQQTAMWQAMLLAAGLPPTKQVVIEGFITVDGQKMSKSLGNVVDPLKLVDEFGAEALRYFIVREFHPFEDSDFSSEKFLSAYNANLANGIGNLTARLLKMASLYWKGTVEKTALEVPLKSTLATVSGPIERADVPLAHFIAQTVEPAYHAGFASYNLQQAADALWDLMGTIDQYIADYEPFKLIKEDPERAQAVVYNALLGLHTCATLLQPLLPETAARILSVVTIDSTTVTTTMLDQPLFARK